MSNHYSQLDITKRERLYELNQQCLNKNTMALKLGVHRSTIYRELKRNKSRIGYLPDKAQCMSETRRSLSKPLKLEGDSELREYITEQLQQGWSPEQISGRLKEERGINVVSHETIYAYIYSKQGLTSELHVYLKRQQKKRKSRLSRKSKRSNIPNRTSIHERPAEIETREDFGNWEGDLVLFSDQRSNLITLRERKSRLFVAIKNSSKKAETTADNIVKKFRGKKKILITTLTLDNGGEFANHESIAKRLEINTFFCDPYASYQKGSVENGNGVLRYDLPRSADIESYTQLQIDKIVNKINNRPMKCLGYKTPAEVFQQHYGELAKGFVALQT